MAYKSKDDQKKYAAAHYARNKEAYKKRAAEHNKKARSRNRAFVTEYLELHPCVDCGEQDSVVLEFDHIRGKKRGSVSDMVRRSMSLDVIWDEIEKCDVRCANCHRRRHHTDGFTTK